MANEQISVYVRYPISLYSFKGKITTRYSENEKIKYNVTIMEHPKLKVDENGFIIFKRDKKYKGFEKIHINGTVTILEPNIITRYVQTTYETIYSKKQYKRRIIGTMMCEDITERYVNKIKYYTQAEYNAMNIYERKNVEKEIKKVETIIDNIDDDIEYENASNISKEIIKDGYKNKETYNLENEVAEYKRDRIIDDVEDLMEFKFVKSIMIKSNQNDKYCVLICDGLNIATIPFNQRFELTNNYDLMHSNNVKTHAFNVRNYKHVVIRFGDELIDDFDLIIETVN